MSNCFQSSYIVPQGCALGGKRRTTWPALVFLRILLIGGGIILVLPSVILAQSTSVNHTNYDADKTLRSNARINPSTLAMEISIPLPSYPGRAGTALASSLDYSSKVWGAGTPGKHSTQLGMRTFLYPRFAARSVGGWTATLSVPQIDDEIEAYDEYGRAWVYNAEEPENYDPVFYIKKFRVLMPDGSTHELRADDAPHSYGTASQPMVSYEDRYSGTFLAVDGSRMRLEWNYTNNVWHNTLYMPDGSRYLDLPLWEFGSAADTTYIDRNGNQMVYHGATNCWTDVLGRTLENPLPVNAQSSPPAEGTRAYTYPGLDSSSPFTIEFIWQKLDTQQTNLSYSATAYCNGGDVTFIPSGAGHLFSAGFNSQIHICGTSTIFNPVVLTEVRFPNGSKYSFRYNIYGEIERIDYPLGAYERFEYAQLPAIASSADMSYDQFNRGVVNRWISVDGTSQSEVQWRYEVERESPSSQQGPYHVKTFAPDGTWSEQLLKDRRSHSSSMDPYGFGDPSIGRAYETRAYDNATNNTLLRRTLTVWTSTGPVTVDGVQGNSHATRDLRVEKEISIIREPNNSSEALAQMSATVYDTVGSSDLAQFAALNTKQAKTYKYKALSLATAQTADAATVSALFSASDLARITESDYLYAANYRTRGLVGLGIESRVIDPSDGQVKARTQTSYDEANFAPLPYSGNLQGWSDPGAGVPRGNATTVARWLNTTNTYLFAHTQYDQFGNVRKVWDARDTALGNPTQIEYSSAYQYAYSTLHTSADPDGFGPLPPLITATEYNLATGLTTATIDANGQRTTYSYNDPLHRLKQVIRAENGGVNEKNQTTISYDDVNRLMTTTSDQNSYGDNLLKSEVLFDGLGRTSEKRQYEAPGSYITIKQLYDGMGRLNKVSNPYRANETTLWTTTAYDALGRVISVTTPDSSAVNTYYQGNQVLVKDQMGKERMSQTNGLGQLTDVWEITAADDSTESISFPDHSEVTAGYRTKYAYDMLGNLKEVTQRKGTSGPIQTRTFVYNSLSQLTDATNPESGHIVYDYDANGNLLHKTDARLITTTYGYDSLNRNTSVGYSNDPANTPGVTRSYDAAINGKGRLWKTETDGDKKSSTAINSYNSLGRPLSQSQKFYANGLWSGAFSVSATYDLAGHLRTQTYPSGHMVTYDYDSAGRTTSFTGNLGEGVPRTYANDFQYTARGGVEQERFGSDIALYHKQRHNQRGQLWDMRLSTKSFSENAGDGDRGAIVNYYSNNFAQGGTGLDNNGNLLRQEIYIPGSGSFQQNFHYDSLNRLDWVAEKLNGTGSETFKQSYSYDRWGNRFINTHPSATFGGVNNLGFEVQTDKNRLYAPGDLALSEAQRRMQYDTAGNLKKDIYTGAGDRVYDAENRMTKAWGNNQWQEYTYNGDGQRVRRKVNGVETWQVYGMSGELLGEYAASAIALNPQKEYGYRNGQLLVTAEPPPTTTENVVWTNTFGVTAAGNSLSKPGADGMYAGAASVQAIASGDGYVEFTATETNKHRIVGLSHGDTDQSYGDIDFGIYPNDAGQLYVYEGGVNRGMFGTYSSGNKLRVSVENGVVKYRKDGTLLYTSTVAPTYPLLVDSWLYSNAATVTNAVVSGVFVTPAEDVTWTNASGVTVTGNNLSKPGADGWYAGASSTQTISGDGYVEFTATETNKHRIVGLSHGDTDQSYGDIDFGIYPNDLGQVHIYEFGQWVGMGMFSTYVSGDVLRVSVENGVVKYRKNGTLLYTSTHAPTYPLLVDTWLYSNGATVTNAKISGSQSSTANLHWLVTDHLGTPRIVVDKTGSLAGVSRHDYLPFGEELFGGTSQNPGPGGRTDAKGYASDFVRQKFTQKERDNETGLDYFGARYYASTQGRFASVDPMMASAKISKPQTLNRYTYVVNNPLRYLDPEGLDIVDADDAWSTLSKDEQLKLVPKLTEVQGSKPSQKELAAARTEFNNKVTAFNADHSAIDMKQTTTNVASVKAFVAELGSNEQAWAQVDKIGEVRAQGNGKVADVTFTAKDNNAFMNALKNDPHFRYRESDMGHTDSFRLRTLTSADPSFHIDRRATFESHWDPTSFFNLQSQEQIRNGVLSGDTFGLVGGAVDMISAGAQHYSGRATVEQVQKFLAPSKQ